MVDSRFVRRSDGPGEGAPLDQLAVLVKRRRETLPVSDGGRGLTIVTAAADAGMSPVTWRRVEAGDTVRGLSYNGVEKVLGWVPGSIGAFLDGTGPPPVDAVNMTGPLTDTSSSAARVDDDVWAARAPSLLDATHDELLAELRRRLHHLEPSAPVAEQRRHLGASSEATETVESVEARGSRAGLPLGDEAEAGDEAAGGGQT